ncbi:uncharacterized protein CCOS01_00140, partial [Colletotrichum costaricense]
HCVPPGLPPALLSRVPSFSSAPCSFPTLIRAPLPSTPLPSAKSSAKVIVTRGPPPNRTVFALSLSFFSCLFQFQTKLLRKLERSPKAKKLTTRQVQPSQASMSTALVQPPTPNHTLSVGTMTECLFSFASSRANVPFTTTPLYEGEGGRVIICPDLGIFPRHKLPNFSKPCAFLSLPVSRLSVYKGSLVPPSNLCHLKL